MARSISIILPVHNVEDCLARRVQELLEVISDVSSQVELLIVDDRSSDGSHEVARQLTRIYPQVRLIENDLAVSATQRALADARGDVVLVDADPRMPISQDTLRRLRQMHQQHEGLSTIDAQRTAIVPDRRSVPHSASRRQAARGSAIPVVEPHATGDLLRNDTLSIG